MMRAADSGIPQDLIDKAWCVVVIPGMKKAGFIFGAEYGREFAVCRRHGGGWSALAAMRSEGGSFGFQIGAPDAAGSIGRSVTAQTDAELQVEMLSYSRSHGLFAGISLSGATFRPDGETNRELYGHDSRNREILTGNFKTPAAAQEFEPFPVPSPLSRSPGSQTLIS